MTSLHDAAFRAGVWQVIEQRAKELKDQAKAELAALEVGDAVAGRYNGQTVAKATKAKGRSKIVIRDEWTLLEWVKENRPTEVTESVNTAYINGFKAVDGVVVDHLGEQVPGAEVVEGEAYVTVRRDKDAPFVVAQLLSGGRLDFNGGIQALPPEPASVDACAGDMRCMYCGRPGGCGGECAGSRAERQRNRWVEDREAGAIG